MPAFHTNFDLVHWITPGEEGGCCTPPKHGCSGGGVGWGGVGGAEGVGVLFPSPSPSHPGSAPARNNVTGEFLATYETQMNATFVCVLFKWTQKNAEKVAFSSNERKRTFLCFFMGFFTFYIHFLSLFWTENEPFSHFSEFWHPKWTQRSFAFFSSERKRTQRTLRSLQVKAKERRERCVHFKWTQKNAENVPFTWKECLPNPGKHPVKSIPATKNSLPQFSLLPLIKILSNPGH